MFFSRESRKPSLANEAKTFSEWAEKKNLDYENQILNAKKEVVKTDPIKDKTKGCEGFDGLFKIYQNKKNGKSFIEIDTSHLDKEFIYFSYIENGVTDAGAVKGSYRGSKIIKIVNFIIKLILN